MHRIRLAFVVALTLCIAAALGSRALGLAPAFSLPAAEMPRQPGRFR